MTHLLWNHNRTTRMIGGNGFLSGDGLMLAVMQDGPLVCIRIHAPTFFQVTIKYFNNFIKCV